jgi:hypothetical protein
MLELQQKDDLPVPRVERAAARRPSRQGMVAGAVELLRRGGEGLPIF